MRVGATRCPSVRNVGIGIAFATVAGEGLDAVAVHHDLRVGLSLEEGAERETFIVYIETKTIKNSGHVAAADRLPIICVDDAVAIEVLEFDITGTYFAKCLLRRVQDLGGVFEETLGYISPPGEDGMALGIQPGIFLIRLVGGDDLITGIGKGSLQGELYVVADAHAMCQGDVYACVVDDTEVAIGGLCKTDELRYRLSVEEDTCSMFFKEIDL